MSKPTSTGRAAITLVLFTGMFAAGPLSAEVRPPLRVPLGKSFQPGMIFPIDYDADRMLPELQSIKDQGFRVICSSARHHDVPVVGSELRTRVDAVLDWCDAKKMGFILELVIQYRGPGEIGDVEKGYTDAVGYVRPHVEHWVETLAGHPCVMAVTLGNEVGAGWPAKGTEAEMPNYTQGWRKWLLERHGDIVSLNAAWGPRFRICRKSAFPRTGTN